MICLFPERYRAPQVNFSAKQKSCILSCCLRRTRDWQTTLLRIVANEVKKGVIYINFPENFNKLGDEFGRALNLTFEEDASFTVQLLLSGIKVMNLKISTLSGRELWMSLNVPPKYTKQIMKADHQLLSMIMSTN